MDMFHEIPDAVCILFAKGVYKQVKVYRRGTNVFAGHGSNFIRLYSKHGNAGGTSLPSVSWLDLDAAGVTMDRLNGPQVAA